MSNKLTDKQKAFCKEYLKDFNGTRAAITVGYKENSARITAAKMLAKANIQKEITKLADKMNEKQGNAIERIILEFQ